ncbi:L-ribulose-5-phosphate 4-epimerase AraD [Spirochaeta dissipatitropha]
MSVYTAIKEEAYEANMGIPAHQLAIFTFGNVSVIDRGLGAVAIKPSGVPYEDLKAEDMVVLSLEGETIEGKLRPSSDTPTHLHLYRSWKEIGGIIHTHSTYATSWAQAGRDIPVYGTTHADHLAMDIPCASLMSAAEVEGNYELETGRQITNCFKQRGIRAEFCPMVLIEGHGPFAWGKTAAKALYHAAVLEQIAQMAWMTESLVAARGLPRYYTEKHFQRKHGPDAYYGQ